MRENCLITSGSFQIQRLHYQPGHPRCCSAVVWKPQPIRPLTPDTTSPWPRCNPAWVDYAQVTHERQSSLCRGSTAFAWNASRATGAWPTWCWLLFMVVVGMGRLETQKKYVCVLKVVVCTRFCLFALVNLNGRRWKRRKRRSSSGYMSLSSSDNWRLLVVACCFRLFLLKRSSFFKPHSRCSRWICWNSEKKSQRSSRCNRWSEKKILVLLYLVLSQ